MSDFFSGIFDNIQLNPNIDWGNTAQSIAGLGQMYAAEQYQQQATENQIAQLRYSGQIAAQGALLSAEGYRKQAALVPEVLQFNLAVDNLNTQRKLQAQGRLFQRTLGSQVSQIAASGVSLTSKSALEVRNETISTAATQMLNTRLDAENARRATVYQAEMQQYQLEEQANVQEYQAQLAQWNADVQAINAQNAQAARSYQSSRQMWNTLPTLMGEFFQQ